MEEGTLNPALSEIDDGSLLHLGRIADRLLAGRPLSLAGPRARRFRAGRGTEFLDYREYTAGDDPRGIDWRATARSRHPLVRRRHDEAASEWYLCLDGSASMGLWDAEKWNLAVQLAAALAYLILRQGNRVGLLVFSQRIDAACPAGRGRIQYGNILRRLRHAQPRRSGGGPSLRACAGRIRQQACVIVLSDFLAEDGMQQGLEELLHLGGNLHAMQILSPRECRVDEAPPLTLQDIESGEQRVLDDPRAAERAGRRLAALQHELTRYCHRRAIPLTPCRTDQAWNRVLLEHLQRLARPRA